MRGIIWAYSRERGIEQLKNIIADYARLYIHPTKQRISQYNSWVQFDNGDMWKICAAADSSRGHRANVSYIDRRIPQDIINNIIRPQTILPPYQAYRYYGSPLEEG